MCSYHKQYCSGHVDHLNGFALLVKVAQNDIKIIPNYLYDICNIYLNSIILYNKTSQVCTLQALGGDTGVD